MDRRRRRRADRRLRRRQRARRGGLRRRRRSTRLHDERRRAPGDVAVFYRTNAQSRVFEEVFIRVGLPYKVVGGVRFYERTRGARRAGLPARARQPRATPSSCAASSTPRARHRRPGRGVRRGPRRARADLLRRRRCGRADEATGPRHRARWRRSRAFTALLDDAAHAGRGRLRAGDVILEAVLDQTGYLAELRASPRPAGRDPGREPRTSSRRWPASSRRRARRRATPRGLPGAGVAGRRRRRDPRRRADADGVVTLMTLHTAKGLEFPVVFLTGLEDGVFPHMRVAGRRQGARGGAPAGVRRHHPGPAAAATCPGR